MKNKLLKILFLLIIFIIILITKVEATPVNPKFEDDIFYESIINALNQKAFNGIKDRSEKYNVTDEELKSITYLYIGNGINDLEKLYNLAGLEYLTSLETLVINYPKIENIDISNNIKLKNITIINGDKLKNIDFSNNVDLERIILTYTHLENLNLSNCPKLEYLEMGAGAIEESLIKELDLSNCKELKHLGIGGNKIEFIDLSENINLEYVKITNGNLKKIILPENSKIKTLSLFDNEIEKIEDIINFETATNLKELYIQDNYIEDFEKVYNKNKLENKILEPQGKEEINYNDEKDNNLYNSQQVEKYEKSANYWAKVSTIVFFLIYMIYAGIIFFAIWSICKGFRISYKNKDNLSEIDKDDLSGGYDEDLSGGDEDKRL